MIDSSMGSKRSLEEMSNNDGDETSGSAPMVRTYIATVGCSSLHL